ncbi:hypothetical protein AXF42_Ash005536 [Apostasia shenzhenica]|uniref:Uncharacterized protein n=1 Tax=Apostasia shenzhenica TaxID=1088818 RepID=A0A2I0B7A1_9ASPA|nr:hypothetical protein AXF42_Ash005536 [Apostasia shenzhenica]
MEFKPTVALRAIFVGGVAVFAKVAGAVKAAGGVKVGAAAAAMTAAATAAVSGTKKEETGTPKSEINGLPFSMKVKPTILKNVVYYFGFRIARSFATLCLLLLFIKLVRFSSAGN